MRCALIVRRRGDWNEEQPAAARRGRVARARAHAALPLLARCISAAPVSRSSSSRGAVPVRVVVPPAVPAAATGSARVPMARVLPHLRLRLRVRLRVLAPLLLVAAYRRRTGLAVRTRLAARRPTGGARLLALLCPNSSVQSTCSSISSLVVNCSNVSRLYKSRKSWVLLKHCICISGLEKCGLFKRLKAKNLKVVKCWTLVE